MLQFNPAETASFQRPAHFEKNLSKTKARDTAESSQSGEKGAAHDIFFFCLSGLVGHLEVLVSSPYVGGLGGGTEPVWLVGGVGDLVAVEQPVSLAWCRWRLGGGLVAVEQSLCKAGI